MAPLRPEDQDLAGLVLFGAVDRDRHRVGSAGKRGEVDVVVPDDPLPRPRHDPERVALLHATILAAMDPDEGACDLDTQRPPGVSQAVDDAVRDGL